MPARASTQQHDGRLSFYAFDKDSNAPLNEGIPSESRGGPRGEPRRADRRSPTRRSSRCPRASSSSAREDQRTGEQRDRGEVDQWWVIKDNPVLSGNDIKNPEQNFENGTGGAPIVTMEFTDQGREAFADTTREIAQRGQDNAVLNGGLQNPIAASHHFAIRLDNELISTPYINFRENPDGIDGSTGRRRSPAGSRSRPPRTSRGCSRSAPCRCGSS